MSERAPRFAFRRRRPRYEVERIEAETKLIRAREHGPLREAIVRGHGCCLVNDPDFDQKLWDEALCAQEEVFLLREAVALAGSLPLSVPEAHFSDLQRLDCLHQRLGVLPGGTANSQSEVDT